MSDGSQDTPEAERSAALARRARVGDYDEGTMSCHAVVDGAKSFQIWCWSSWLATAFS